MHKFMVLLKRKKKKKTYEQSNPENTSFQKGFQNFGYFYNSRKYRHHMIQEIEVQPDRKDKLSIK